MNRKKTMALLPGLARLAAGALLLASAPMALAEVVDKEAWTPTTATYVNIGNDPACGNSSNGCAGFDIQYSRIVALGNGADADRTPRFALPGIKRITFTSDTGSFNMDLKFQATVTQQSWTAETDSLGSRSDPQTDWNIWACVLQYMPPNMLKLDPNTTGLCSVSRLNPPVQPSADEEISYKITVGISPYLRVPSAGIAPGIYEGTLILTAGEAGDIALGPGMVSPPPSVFEVRFKLTIQKDFELVFENDLSVVALAPPGGKAEWDRWQAGGAVPSKLVNSLPFNLRVASNGTRGTFSYRCGTVAANSLCALTRTGGTEQVPVKVGFSWLNGASPIGPSDGTPVGTGKDFRYTFEAFSRGAVELETTAVTDMVKFPGSMWEGDITVMFDVQI
ncbi:hypothetical protein [Pseudomonas typographi]|uniref:Fimbrial protein n=1 Tax=Pseudomonas typographi TaxID=2715964 RepID=A0ABR7Z9B7_9PSED|nr:hypothetical protein [Pseudomonas typographi]MBD1589874.1 hypothetical protein [Pseudomonas typographi]MBD1601898.1 hypothetical protein [Pseudomonas typographi]